MVKLDQDLLAAAVKRAASVKEALWSNAIAVDKLIIIILRIKSQSQWPCTPTPIIIGSSSNSSQSLDNNNDRIRWGLRVETCLGR